MEEVRLVRIPSIEEARGSLKPQVLRGSSVSLLLSEGFQRICTRKQVSWATSATPLPMWDPEGLADFRDSKYPGE